jgi:hypothetical protein
VSVRTQLSIDACPVGVTSAMFPVAGFCADCMKLLCSSIGRSRHRMVAVSSLDTATRARFAEFIDVLREDFGISVFSLIDSFFSRVSLAVAVQTF